MVYLIVEKYKSHAQCATKIVANGYHYDHKLPIKLCRNTIRDKTLTFLADQKIFTYVQRFTPATFKQILIKFPLETMCQTIPLNFKIGSRRSLAI